MPKSFRLGGEGRRERQSSSQTAAAKVLHFLLTIYLQVHAFAGFRCSNFSIYLAAPQWVAAR